MMKKEQGLLKRLLIISVLSLLTFVSGCKHGQKIEICLLNGLGQGQCNDPRLPEGEQAYNKTAGELKNYVCTNPDDFNDIISGLK